MPLKEMKRKFAVSGVNIATKLATTLKSVVVKVAETKATKDETKATKDEQMVEGSHKISSFARAVVQVAQGEPQEQVSQAASQALVQRAPQPVPHGEGEETQDALDVGGTEGKAEEGKGQEHENEEQEIGQETQDEGTHLHCDVAADGNNRISPANKFIASLMHVSPHHVTTQHVTMQDDANEDKVADCHESKDAACHEGLAVGVGHNVRIGCGHEALRPNNLQCQVQLRDVEKGTNEGGGKQSEETEGKGTEHKAEKEEVTERHEAENTETTKKKNIEAETRISVPTKVAGPVGGMMLSELRRKFLSTSAPRVSVLTNTSETEPVAIGSTRGTSLHGTPLHVSACQTSLATVVAVATSARERAAQEGVADDVSQGAVAHVSKGGTSQGTAAKGAPSVTAAGEQIVDGPAGKRVAEEQECEVQHEEKHLKGVVQGAFGAASGAPLGVATASRLGVVSSAPPLGVASWALARVPLVPACPEGAHGSYEPLAHHGEEVERVRHEGQEDTVERDSVGEVLDREKQRDTEKRKKKERKEKKERTKKRIERETEGRDKGDGGEGKRQEKGGGKGRGNGEGMVLRIPRDTGISANIY